MLSCCILKAIYKDINLCKVNSLLKNFFYILIAHIELPLFKQLNYKEFYFVILLSKIKNVIKTNYYIATSSMWVIGLFMKLLSLRDIQHVAGAEIKTLQALTTELNKAKAEGCTFFPHLKAGGNSGEHILMQFNENLYGEPDAIAACSQSMSNCFVKYDLEALCSEEVLWKSFEPGYNRV
jgi:hypothetical protein